MSPITDLQTLTLGPDGPTVPALGVGTWAWGDSLFWDYGKAYSDSDLHAAFEACLDAGLTLFDTAEIYGFGESERLLGRFMQQRPQQALIATKYFPLPWRFSQQSVVDALAASLDRLQAASVALYQVHQPLSFLLSQKDLMQALAAEVKRGRIGAIGVSNYPASQMREAHGYLAEHGIPLAVNQVPYSLLNRKIETSGVMATARELDVTILAYSPLAQGLLTGKYTPETDLKPAGARRISPSFSQDNLTKLKPVIQALKEIGEKHERTPAQVALNWLVAQGNVLPIPGAKNARQAAQNAGALGWQLAVDELDRLGQLTQGYR
ncbi:aldo/keto reductase [Phormidium tenue]|uniref:2,5-didehydrogluconate reductase n=1 Tax=Phormidium tenue NIES-30 TaxID=549789 RepID=A0A1U7IZZ3_9CYAN|nr:aldo/keto reductase [Phormidium tenue]MBD2234097.1 aldo/keto reductase [Phormidium tenue FACHB-1052]OKH44664.1 2,5-didehydrogluconate reductase [Phormidium tenue NIES-30]